MPFLLRLDFQKIKPGVESIPTELPSIRKDAIAPAAVDDQAIHLSVWLKYER